MPALCQGLLGVVRGWGHRPAQDPHLVPLALEVLVGAVHVLHASRTPAGAGSEPCWEGYFRVLNTDWPARNKAQTLKKPMSPCGQHARVYGLSGRWQ